jgi:hypothetical protein
MMLPTTFDAVISGFEIASAITSVPEEDMLMTAGGALAVVTITVPSAMT